VDISLIWAMSENGVIGRDNGLPWRLPKDMQFFMAVTMGKPVIMGRRTFESMKAPLAGRPNIVLTRQPDFARAGVDVVSSFAQALRVARDHAEAAGEDEIMIIGGADIYRLGLAVATKLYVTEVAASVEGDTFFPEVDWSRWQRSSTEEFAADERHTYPFRISIYIRS
jgi:dihydrofolate reductase